MAYAFNALDNYFKRDKKTQTGAGDLQKGGGTGAPPPTAAAENLAKSAETSQEQGNAAGRFAALQKGPTGAIAGRLAAPGQQKATNWGTETEKMAKDYTAAGEKQAQDTFKGFNAADVTAAEGGDKSATLNLTSQLGYGNTTFDLAPVQLDVPTLDTTSMLRGGVSGIQAALQKRGGRYTPGMAAMDATALSANRGAIGQLQGQFGGLQEGMRKAAENVRGLEGTLEASGTQRGKDIAQQVRDQLTARNDQLFKAYKSSAELEANTRGQRTKDKALYDAAGYGGANAKIKAGKGTYYAPVDPAYANIANILGLGPTTVSADYADWSPDYVGMDQAATVAPAVTSPTTPPPTTGPAYGPSYGEVDYYGNGSTTAPSVVVPPAPAPIPMVPGPAATTATGVSGPGATTATGVTGSVNPDLANQIHTMIFGKPSKGGPKTPTFRSSGPTVRGF